MRMSETDMITICETWANVSDKRAIAAAHDDGEDARDVAGRVLLLEGDGREDATETTAADDDARVDSALVGRAD